MYNVNACVLQMHGTVRSAQAAIVVLIISRKKNECMQASLKPSSQEHKTRMQVCRKAVEEHHKCELSLCTLDQK